MKEKEKNKIIECVTYARVSSREQEREGFSIPAQLELLEKYATKNGFKNLQTFVDVETAKCSGRTNFEKMLTFIRKNKRVKTILVEKTDRLYRNLPDYVTIDALHLDLHFVKEGVVLNDDSHSSEKFMHLIKVGMAKQYIDNLSEEVKKGIAQKCKEGHYPAKAPIGYKNFTLPSKKKIIVIDEDVAPYIEKAFTLYLTGLYSFKSLAQKLTEDGFLINGKPCRKHNVENIFDNPIYYGDFIHKGIQYKGKHEPIITRELWNAVQTKRKFAGSPRVIVHNFPYTNLIKCETCGCFLTAEIKKGKYIYYHCTGNKGGNCKRSYIRQEYIESAIVGILEQIALTEQDIKDAKTAVKELLKLKSDYEENSLDVIESQIKTIKKRLNKLYMDKIDENIDDDFYYETRKNWQSEIDELTIRRDAIIKCDKYFIDDVVRVLELAKTAHDKFLRVDDNEKRKMINLICSNLSWDGQELHITLKSTFGALLKSASCRLNLGQDDEVRNNRIQNISKYFVDNIGTREQIELFETLRMCA